MPIHKTRSLLIAGLALCAAQTLAAPAGAVVERKGDWTNDPQITLNLDAKPRSKAVQALAKEAGWSLVFRNAPNDPVDVHVTKQPASKVLELILHDRRLRRHARWRPDLARAIGPRAARHDRERRRERQRSGRSTEGSCSCRTAVTT